MAGIFFAVRGVFLEGVNVPTFNFSLRFSLELLGAGGGVMGWGNQQVRDRGAITGKIRRDGRGQAVVIVPRLRVWMP